jgi:hypothetical protein
LVLVVIGPLWPWLGRLGLGRLPGDIVIERGEFRFYFPIMTCLVVSGIVSLIFWLLNDNLRVREGHISLCRRARPFQARPHSAVGLRAVVAIDNVACWPAICGVRMVPDVTTEKAFWLVRGIAFKERRGRLAAGWR